MLAEAYKQGHKDAKDLVCYDKECNQRIPTIPYECMTEATAKELEYILAKTREYCKRQVELEKDLQEIIRQVNEQSQDFQYLEVLKDFKSLDELFEAFPNEQSCIDHLGWLRWHGNVVSPFDSESKVYKCKDNKYRCKNTGKYFNVKTNTLFDSSKVELRKWFAAIWLATSHKKGISSAQLARDIDVTQKTALLMLQKIKKCFNIDKTKDNDK